MGESFYQIATEASIENVTGAFLLGSRADDNTGDIHDITSACFIIWDYQPCHALGGQGVTIAVGIGNEHLLATEVRENLYKSHNDLVAIRSGNFQILAEAIVLMDQVEDDLGIVQKV
jgi:hypothetical protein